MSGLQINITAAGRAAIVNAENTGTAPMRIAQIGVSASSAGLSNGALAGEIKRLGTFAGAAVADDTIHITIRDDGPDAYSLRSFALYLQDGTLFAWYVHAAGVILEKSAQAMLLLAADVRFVELNAASLEFGDTNWINPPATTTVPGVVQLATTAEGVAGAETGKAMTPAGTKGLLDERFGAGAPSGFMKGLLNLATAALFRAAIGLGNAATRDTGHGNGLDADLLDGQHGAWYRDWANLQNVPGAFPPSAHTHAWNQISGTPDTAIRWPTFAEVTNKPGSYPPSAHTHAMADVTGLPGALDAKASLNTNVAFRDVTATRGDGSGALWLGGAGGYIFLKTDNTLEIRLGSTANYATLNSGGTIWTAGNFNPAAKANLSGATFTGSIGVNGNIATLSLESTSQIHGYQIQSNVSDAVDYGLYFNRKANGVWTTAGYIAATGALIWNFTVDVNAAIRSLGPGAALYFQDRSSSTQWAWYCTSGIARLYNGSTDVITVSPTGAVTSTGGFQGSSIRIKDIEAACPYGLREILRLKPVVGRYKPEFGAGTDRRLFLIAEDVLEDMPELVNPEGIEFQGEMVPSLEIGGMNPVFVQAFHDMAEELRVLRDRVAKLEAA